ncbi:hypothetical protein ACNKHR_05035 [Shigella flexneri]
MMCWQAMIFSTRRRSPSCMADVRRAGVIKSRHHATGHHYRAVDNPDCADGADCYRLLLTLRCVWQDAGLKPFIW